MLESDDAYQSMPEDAVASIMSRSHKGYLLCALLLPTCMLIL